MEYNRRPTDWREVTADSERESSTCMAACIFSLKCQFTFEERISRTPHRALDGLIF